MFKVSFLNFGSKTGPMSRQVAEEGSERHSGKGGIQLPVNSFKLCPLLFMEMGLKTVQPWIGKWAIWMAPWHLNGPHKGQRKTWEENDFPKVKLWHSRRAEGKADPHGAVLSILTSTASSSQAAAGVILWVNRLQGSCLPSSPNEMSAPAGFRGCCLCFLSISESLFLPLHRTDSFRYSLLGR